jgi:hypothetical protein
LEYQQALADYEKNVASLEVAVGKRLLAKEEKR